MNLAIVTTTINVPTVLRDYRRECPDAHIIVIGDHKTPHEDVLDLCVDIGNARYLWPGTQHGISRKVSAALGWNCIQRRNIGTLEALRLGADVIMLLDDDNAPCHNYGARLMSWFEQPRIVPAVIWNHRWFNIGHYGREDYFARGLPVSQRGPERRTDPDYMTTVEVLTPGVFTSLIHGDPDIAATERMEIAPSVTRYDLPSVHNGPGNAIAIYPRHTWGPINSQATAWKREFAPLALLPPAIGRYDDIWGGYMAQRVMGGYGAHVVYGEPSVRQNRNVHNLVTDLEAELYGMKHTEAFVAFLDGVRLPGVDPLDDLAAIIDELGKQDMFPWPEQAQAFCRAWVDEVGRL